MPPSSHRDTAKLIQLVMTGNYLEWTREGHQADRGLGEDVHRWQQSDHAHPYDARSGPLLRSVNALLIP